MKNVPLNLHKIFREEELLKFPKNRKAIFIEVTSSFNSFTQLVESISKNISSQRQHLDNLLKQKQVGEISTEEGKTISVKNERLRLEQLKKDLQLQVINIETAYNKYIPPKDEVS